MHGDHQSGNNITYLISPAVTNADLDALFTAAWPDHALLDVQQVLGRSLAYVCAYAGAQLVGFVNLTWDGGVHAFMLDTTVHPDWQRRGIGRQLVAHAVATAQAHGLEWVHVDWEPRLRDFYLSCGFAPTEAGLIHLAR